MNLSVLRCVCVCVCDGVLVVPVLNKRNEYVACRQCTLSLLCNQAWVRLSLVGHLLWFHDVQRGCTWCCGVGGNASADVYLSTGVLRKLAVALRGCSKKGQVARGREPGSISTKACASRQSVQARPFLWMCGAFAFGCPARLSLDVRCVCA